jgi:hypothetical protein
MGAASSLRNCSWRARAQTVPPVQSVSQARRTSLSHASVHPYSTGEAWPVRPRPEVGCDRLVGDESQRPFPSKEIFAAHALGEPHLKASLSLRNLNVEICWYVLSRHQLEPLAQIETSAIICGWYPSSPPSRFVVFCSRPLPGFSLCTDRR